MIDWLKKTTNQFKSKITGNHKFYVKLQPDTIDTSSTITVTSFTDKTESALVPCHYRWFKIRNGLTQQITKYKGSSYMCDPSDIGAIIQVEIASNDQQYSGKAIAQLGPVRLSLDLRKQIQSTLINGSSLINASIHWGQQERQCQLKIFEDMIKICHFFSQANYSFDYTLFQPKIQSLNRDQTKLQLIFGEKHEYQAKKFMSELFNRNINSNQNSQLKYSHQFRIQLSFQSRFFKDLFILTLKSFYTKREMKNSAILHKIQHSTFKQSQNFDYMFQIESLRADLAKTIQNNERNQMDRNRFKQQISRLQKQIQQIILTYTKIVQDKCKNQQDFNKSYSVLTTKRDEVISKKYQNLQSQNMNLNQRIKHLSAEIDQIRFNTSLVKNNQTKFQANQVFMKKNSGMGYQDSGFVRMLDQLSVSHVKQIPDDFLNVKKQLSQVKEQKIHLQKKLEKSFQKIDNLEKQLRKQGSNHNHSAINFSYASQNSEDSRINMTSPFQQKQRMDKINRQNFELKRLNETLKSQNKKLNSELSLSMSRINTKGPDVKFSVGSHNKNENKSQKQNEALRKQLQFSKSNLQIQRNTNSKLIKQKAILQQKINELKSQLDLYRKNQDIFNRSQNLSMEMNDYNEEQLRILKEHNQFLTSQNQKLSAACQKYMKEAKENMRLRKQILTLKQKLNSKLLNPQNTVMSIQL